MTRGHGPGGPQGSYLRAIMVSLLHLFLANSVLPLSLCSSLPLCCLQAACTAQRSPAAGAGGAVLPRGGKMLPAQITKKDPPGRKSPFPNGLWRVGCYFFSSWILGQNLHNLPTMPPSLTGTEQVPGWSGAERCQLGGPTQGHGPPSMFPVLVHTRAWGAEQWVAGGLLSPCPHPRHPLASPPSCPLPSPGSLPILQPPCTERCWSPLFEMTLNRYRERGPQRQPWTGCPQQGSDQSLWEKSPSTDRVWIRPYPGLEQFVLVLHHVCEMLLLFCISFSLSLLLLFFLLESFKLGAL